MRARRPTALGRLVLALLAAAVVAPAARAGDPCLATLGAVFGSEEGGVGGDIFAAERQMELGMFGETTRVTGSHMEGRGKRRRKVLDRETITGGGVEAFTGILEQAKSMFGLGGTYVETFKDVSFRLAPMWEISADKMIKSIKSYKILEGVRGEPPSDVGALKDCILRLSQMVSDHPEIAELDINPLLIYPEGEGCVVIDSRILLKKVD